MDLIETFVRSPVKVSVGVLLIVMFGVIAIVKLPRQLTPDVEIPTITIETRWPGASPQEVEREIVQEQEEQLASHLQQLLQAEVHLLEGAILQQTTLPRVPCRQARAKEFRKKKVEGREGGK